MPWLKKYKKARYHSVMLNVPLHHNSLIITLCGQHFITSGNNQVKYLTEDPGGPEYCDACVCQHNHKETPLYIYLTDEDMAVLKALEPTMHKVALLSHLQPKHTHDNMRYDIEPRWVRAVKALRKHEGYKHADRLSGLTGLLDEKVRNLFAQA